MCRENPKHVPGARAWTIALIAGSLLLSGFTYKLALPGREFSFPADHASHPDYQTEWWYYTGHLATERGRRYGYQVTFFRFGLRDRQAGHSPQHPPLFTDLYMAHFALSDLERKRFVFHERVNRGLDRRAGAATDRYLVWNENWKVHGNGTEHVISVEDRGTRLRLSLSSMKPPVLHGRNGLSQKGEGEGRASYYYSFTRMKTEGELTLDGKRERVRGQSWMDHEFGSNQLGPDQVGWDWFSIQFDDQRELMLYLIRRVDSTPDSYSSGTIINPDGSHKHLRLRDFRIEALEHWTSRKSGARYPIRWRVAVPGESLTVEVTPAFADQELITERSTRVTYWEGAVNVAGRAKGNAVTGSGYVEMTGYAGKLKF